MKKILLALLMLIGCNSEANNDTKYIKYKLPMGMIYEFKLQDGTKCVTIWDNAITCDWNNKKYK